MPRATNRQTAIIPATERRGLQAGKSASNPASIPAAVTKQEHSTKKKTTGAHLPNRSEMQLRYPSCAFPNLKKNATSAHSNMQENNTGIKKAPCGKNRTSSAPEINPAPITVPTMNNVSFNTSICLYLCRTQRNMPKIAEFFSIYVRHSTLTIDKNRRGVYNIGEIF